MVGAPLYRDTRQHSHGIYIGPMGYPMESMGILRFRYTIARGTPRGESHGVM